VCSYFNCNFNQFALFGREPSFLPPAIGLIHAIRSIRTHYFSRHTSATHFLRTPKLQWIVGRLCLFCDSLYGSRITPDTRYLPLPQQSCSSAAVHYCNLYAVTNAQHLIISSAGYSTTKYSSGRVTRLSIRWSAGLKSVYSRAPASPTAVLSTELRSPENIRLLE
jgi:hypothetical protein